jgi:putative membrane protein
MSVFRLFIAEMAKLAAKKGVLISVIAALLVPVVYGGILLSPTWGPYDNLSNLPVAVVNKDKGALSDDEPINVGEDLVADLKKGKDLGWEFVSSTEAKKGLDNLDYYMVIEIPEDFSEKVTTVLEDQPQKLELTYIQNEGLNFMAAQVTRSATEKIREKLGDKITEKYAKNMFASLGEVSDGFQSAADGSKQLNDGMVELNDGTSQLLQSLTEKSGDISKLANGASELEAGTGQMLSSLSGKQGDISKLASGSKDLSDGTAEMLQSLQAKSGDISRLAEGAKQLEKSIPELKAGTTGILNGLKGAQAAIKTEIGPGTQAISAGVKTVADESKQLGAVLNSLSSDLQDFLAAHPELQNDPAFMKIFMTGQGLALKANDPEKAKQLEALQQGAGKVAGAFTENAVPNPKSLADGVNQLVAGQTAIDNGVAVLDQSVPLLQQGTASVENGWGALTEGVTKLNVGASQISAGNSTVEKGWRDLTSGASRIHSGMSQVSDGNASVEKGWGDLTEGVTKLNDGAGKLNDGSGELSSGLMEGAEKTSGIKNATDANISMFSSPVELKSDTVNKYPLYRDSTAPFVISLALFVGILIMSLFINFKKPEEVSALSWFGAKFMNLGSLALVQALLLSIVVLLFLDMNVYNGAGFILFALFVSLVFTAIVLFFASFGNAGRFVAFALVVLQLSTTGANLPIDMLPENLRTLSEFLPFTYSIAGFKALTSLNDSGAALSNMSILLIYFSVFGVLSTAAFLIKSGKSQSQKFEIAG